MKNSNLEKKHIENEKGKIFYFSQKTSGNSAPVVFLHGLSSNHTTWINLMEELAKENISSLALDMRGHGHSDKARIRNRYRIPVFSKDLENIIQKEGLENIILIGYSFSGAIVLDYVLAHPEKVKGIVLISANHSNPLKYKWYGWITPFLAYIINAFGWLLIWQRRKYYYYFQQGKAMGYWDSTLKGFATMPLSINYWMLSEMGRIDFSDDLEKIDCPVLIVRSATDPFFGQKEMEDMKSKIKNCECITLNETSHFLATEHQDKLKDLIYNFIRYIA